MKRICLLAFENGIASTVIGPWEIFQYANKMADNKTSPLFKVKIISQNGKPVTCSEKVMIQPDGSLADIEGSDLLILCSPGSVTSEVLEKHRVLYPEISSRHKSGMGLAGICTGSFLLAEAGVLDGKTATTHWNLAKRFSQRYPRVNLNPDRIVTDEGNIICAGGVYSALDLALYIVEKFCGREIAIKCSKGLIIDAGRQSQARYSIFNFQKQHNDEDILALQEWIENNFNQNLVFKEIATQNGMSPRNFERRFKRATGDSPQVYLQRLRIEASRRELESGNKSVEEIAIQVGYANTDFFRKLFKRYLDVTPKTYRQKFQFAIKK